MTCIITAAACPVLEIFTPDEAKKNTKIISTVLICLDAADDRTCGVLENVKVHGYFAEQIDIGDVLYIAAKLFIGNVSIQTHLALLFISNLISERVHVRSILLSESRTTYKRISYDTGTDHLTGNLTECFTYSQYSTSSSSILNCTMETVYPDYKWRARKVPALKGTLVQTGFLNTLNKLVVFEVSILNNSPTGKKSPDKESQSSKSPLKFFSVQNKFKMGICEDAEPTETSNNSTSPSNEINQQPSKRSKFTRNAKNVQDED